MPCYVSDSENLYFANLVNREISTLLCQACLKLTEEQMKSIIFTNNYEVKNLYQWHLAHQKQDEVNE